MATPTNHRAVRGLRVVLNFTPEQHAILLLVANQGRYKTVEEAICAAIATEATATLESLTDYQANRVQEVFAR